MKQWQIELIRWSNFSLEAFCFYVLMFPLYGAYGTFPPVVPYIIVAVASAVIFGFLLGKTKSVKVAVIGIPIVIIIAGVVDFSLMMAAFITVMAFWRITVYYQEYDHGNEFATFLFTLGAGIIYYIWFSAIDNRHFLLFLVFAHFLLAMGVKTLSLALHANVAAEQKKKHLQWIAGGLLSVGALSVLLSVVFPFLQWLFIQAVRLMFLIFGLAAYPFIYLVQELSPGSSGSEDAPGEHAGDEPPGINFEELEMADSIISFENFFWIVTGIILLLIVLAVVSNIRKVGTKHVEFDDIEDLSLTSEKKSGSFWSSLRKQNAPKNEIRRQFYQLQGSLVKTEWARRENETVEDWFKRLPIDDSRKTNIIRTYQKVRYGNIEISHEEISQYKDAMKQVKKEIKDHQKNAS